MSLSDFDFSKDLIIVYCGDRRNVRVTRTSDDSRVPQEVREGLVGLVVPTIFTKELFEEQAGVKLSVPANSRLAYSFEVAEALQTAGKSREASSLVNYVNSPFHLYVFEPDIYELLDPDSFSSVEDF